MAAIASSGKEKVGGGEQGGDELEGRAKYRMEFLNVTSKLKLRAEQIFKSQKRQASIKLKPQQLKALLAKRDDREASVEDLNDRFDFPRGASRSSSISEDVYNSALEAAGVEIGDELLLKQTSRLAQMKSLFMKESEEIFVLRQTAAELTRYIGLFKKELQRLQQKEKRCSQKLSAMAKSAVSRKKQLEGYGFSSAMALPFETLALAHIRVEQENANIQNECIRVVNNRLLESEALETSIKLKIVNTPKERRSRSSWGKVFFRKEEGGEDTQGSSREGEGAADGATRNSVGTGGGAALQPAVSRDFFKLPHVLIKGDPVLMKLNEAYSDVKADAKWLQKNFSKPLKGLLRSRTTKARRAELLLLLKANSMEELESNRFPVRLTDKFGNPMACREIRQCLFDTIVGDQRTREGRLLERWRLRMKEDEALLPPCTIVAFCNYMEQLIVARYQLDGKEGEQFLGELGLLSRNMVFAKLHSISVSYNAGNLKKKNELWQKRVGWMRRRSQKEMFIADEYVVGTPGGADARPYDRAIKSFSKLIPCKSPATMTEEMLCAVKIVHDDAKAAHGKAIGGMEDLFPVLTYVLVHCELSNIHTYLAYLENFSMGNGEAGFYLCSMQACVSWVLQQREDTIDADSGEQKPAGKTSAGDKPAASNDVEEQRKIAELPIVNYPSPEEENKALETLETWMVGADMSEDTYDMLL